MRVWLIVVLFVFGCILALAGLLFRIMHWANSLETEWLGLALILLSAVFILWRAVRQK